MTDPLLPKITELKEKRFRTVTKKDALGNRVRSQEPYIALREVQTVAQGPRFGHFIIDLIIYQILIFVFNFVLGFVLAFTKDAPAINATYALIGQLFNLLLYPFMYFICESTWQRTVGKFLTSCIVIDEYGEKPASKTIVLRSLLRLVPFEAFSCLGGRHSRGWHDKWSKTWVVTQEELATLKKLQQEQAKIPL